jgi:hypothetical protein
LGEYSNDLEVSGALCGPRSKPPLEHGSCGWSLARFESSPPNTGPSQPNAATEGWLRVEGTSGSPVAAGWLGSRRDSPRAPHSSRGDGFRYLVHRSSCGGRLFFEGKPKSLQEGARTYR